jgi:putative ATP-dependent endonuclease of OLD family
MISGTEAVNLWVSLATQEGRLDCCQQAVFRLSSTKSGNILRRTSADWPALTAYHADSVDMRKLLNYLLANKGSHVKLTNISVTNYKGLSEAGCKLSDFVCVVGENNAGKSSLIQAILLFINGSKLSKDSFYDPAKEILLTVDLSDVTDDVLSKLEEDHRQKLEAYVESESLTLARRYSTDGSSKLRVVTHVPKDAKYRTETVSTALSGKKGKEIVALLKAIYPEVGDDAAISAIGTQKAAKELIETHVATLLPDDLVLEDIPLPTGIDNSIRAILPEPIYIPAVKDLIDDLKTKEGASFGKLLNILLDVIEEDLAEAAETFENLRKKLNRI